MRVRVKLVLAVPIAAAAALLAPLAHAQPAEIARPRRGRALLQLQPADPAPGAGRNPGADPDLHAAAAHARTVTSGR
jgi:hypothetical protein